MKHDDKLHAQLYTYMRGRTPTNAVLDEWVYEDSTMKWTTQRVRTRNNVKYVLTHKLTGYTVSSHNKVKAAAKMKVYDDSYRRLTGQ
jgi:hypothetical protein